LGHICGVRRQRALEQNRTGEAYVKPIIRLMEIEYMLNQKMKPIAAAVGTAFVASLATASVAQAEDDLFVANDLPEGYDLLAAGHGKDGEGKCGEGKCGEAEGDKDGEGKCGEGKCGEAEGDKDGEGKDGEGKCGEGKCGEADADKDAEGKCGEGKCGEGKCGGAR
jgi:uncharacterized low-complexity protein